MSTLVLEAHEISKSFGATQALSSVYFNLYAGEVLAVVGENGAGKSTLMRILSGVEQQDGGYLQFRGHTLPILNVASALTLGIALIHQELNLADNLSIAENIFLGREPTFCGILRSHKLHKDAEIILKRVGLDMPASTIVSKLSLAQKQQVEIARALSLSAEIIIFDEPTSSLSLQESEKLFELIRELRNQGIAIVYISHRLAEVKSIARRVLVLRDGKNARFLSKQEITHDAMISLMIGREIKNPYPWRECIKGELVLDVTELCVAPFYSPVSLQLHVGEIVGLGGLVGAGRSELLKGIFGLNDVTSGEVLLGDGEKLKIGKAACAVDAGMAFVPENRKEEGLILEESVRRNISLAALRKQKRILLNRRAESRVAEELKNLLSIKAESLHMPVSTLSGGNQQKVVMAKWLATLPRILLLDEPTRGVDVGAKRELYDALFSLAQQGTSILFISSDMEELLGIADRVYVMHQGKIAGEVPRDSFSEEIVMTMATGTQLKALY